MFLRSVGAVADVARNDRPQVALVGRSNVGKSTMINALSGQHHLAKVSASPGRTQTINIYELDPRYYLIDLPGYGFARHVDARAKFAELITSYLRETKQLVCVLLVIDCRRGLTDLDTEMMDWLLQIGKSVIIVANKADKLNHEQTLVLTRQLQAAYPGVPHIFHSHKSAVQRGEIRLAIEGAVKATRRA